MGTGFAEWLNDNIARLVELRRDLHAHPELGFEEERTSRIVADMLGQADIEVTRNVGRTGVVGVIKGRLPGQRSIGLRADMDALPIHEATGLSYASQSSGCMHACGHDGHTTMLLGAALYLAENPDFGGTLNLIFQPAEEGRGGANSMLADGIFDIVSSGSTLFMNGLKEVETVMKSEAVLVANKQLSEAQEQIIERLLFRIRSVRKAKSNKYILLNAPNDKLDQIVKLLPGMKSPTILPLAEKGWSSVHSVLHEDEFWHIIERLKDNGAQGILVVPIEKMIV